MNLLSWNCRGLGNPRRIGNPLCSKKSLECIRSRLGLESLFVVDPVGCSGGLALLWSNSTLLEIYNYSRSHINTVVKDSDGNE
jgi:hypothetical protein